MAIRSWEAKKLMSLGDDAASGLSGFMLQPVHPLQEVRPNFRGKIRALIVDGVRTSRLHLKAQLRSHGVVQTKEAGNGEEALDLASQEAFDIIFIEKVLPAMDGIETTRRLRGMGVGAKIAAVTADESQPELFWEAGIDDYFVKPADNIRLLSLLHDVDRIIASNY